jgi:hypothetical protein
MAADHRPRTLVDGSASLAGVTADNERLRSTIGSLQSEIIRKDAEIARVTKPKLEPRKLDPNARDQFARPFRG